MIDPDNKIGPSDEEQNQGEQENKRTDNDDKDLEADHDINDIEALNDEIVKIKEELDKRHPKIRNNNKHDPVYKNNPFPEGQLKDLNGNGGHGAILAGGAAAVVAAENSVGLLSSLASMSISDLFSLIVSWVASGAMIFGGAVPYIPQYRDIRKTENTEGFSTKVCLVLMIANILRILYWFGSHFETPLLLQSYIMIITMLVMLQLCIKIKYTGKNQSPQVSRIKRTFIEHPIDYFWQWTRFIDYVQFLLLFTTVVGYFTYFLINISWYIETIGFLAVFCEAMLGMPQFIKNYTNKSTQGMSKIMVLMWTNGDVFKTGYFIMKDAPTQFKFCGMLQVCVDLAILGQVVYYGRAQVTTQDKLRKKHKKQETLY